MPGKRDIARVEADVFAKRLKITRKHGVGYNVPLEFVITNSRVKFLVKRFNIVIKKRGRDIALGGVAR